jgi:hypothetical protein
VLDFLQNLFSSGGLMPHGHCYLWNPRLVWLHVISDGLIALAYTSIPFTLVYLARKRRDIPFNWMFFCFGMFIIACGATHVMEIWTLWTPTYWLSGAIKAITAAASVPTAVLLVKLVPYPRANSREGTRRRDWRHHCAPGAALARAAGCALTERPRTRACVTARGPSRTGSVQAVPQLAYASGVADSRSVA